MILKIKLLAALATLTSMECVAPAMRDEAGEMGRSRQGLSLSELPPTPEVKVMRGWERGMGTGLPASGALSAHLVLLKDPESTTGRIAAFGFDPASGTSLFAFSVSPADVAAFQSQWALDTGSWRTISTSSAALTGSTDGIGGTPIPIPRPGLLPPVAWRYAFYAWQIQAQIDQESAKGERR